MLWQFAGILLIALAIVGSRTSAWSNTIGFFYRSFARSHSGTDAQALQKDEYATFLESKYKSQAQDYDASRAYILPGRQAMLRLVAAQIKHMLATYPGLRERKLIWVDVGGGTAWAIEALSALLPIHDVFERIYIVDLTPSLLRIAEERVTRFGWTNVCIVEADASQFRLSEWEAKVKSTRCHAELITMSHALSLMPDFYPVADMCESLLSPDGIIGVVDFCLANVEDVVARNYTAGFQNRNTKYWKRILFMALAEADRTGADAHRRNYFEYKFGNVVALHSWEFHWRFIPYYAWIGCRRSCNFEVYQKVRREATKEATAVPQSKLLDRILYNDMRQNLKFHLPAPSYAYQNYPWRLPYEEKWESDKDTPVGTRSGQCTTWYIAGSRSPGSSVSSVKRVLALQASSDQIFERLMAGSAHIITVDPSPAQNHLLELMIAASIILDANGCRELFTTRDNDIFRGFLFDNLSPYMSSRALNWWLVKVGGYFQRQRSSIASCNPRLYEEYYSALSSSETFNNLKIYTDELMSVLRSLEAGSIDIVDLGDLTKTASVEPQILIPEIKRVLAKGGSLRVLEQSSSPTIVRSLAKEGFGMERKYGYAP